MADVNFDEFESGSDAPDGVVRGRAWVNVAGALTSLALIVGLGVWGYRIAVRDVMGIPVVRALEGPMRVAPDDPGGNVAAHQGLSVNEVAASGAASPPAARLVLAPSPVALAPDDAPGLAVGVPVMVEAAPSAVRLVSAAGGAPDSNANVLALAEALASGGLPPSAPDSVVADDGNLDRVALPAATSTAAPAIGDPQTPVSPDAGTAVARSLRPRLRPDVIPVAVFGGAAGLVAEVDAATLTVGTRLVQLGAFDDAEAARAEWDKLSGRFGDLLADKSRVVQAAQSGGRTFFRLRAHGFANEDDTRRFCSALLAENAACIPVTLR